MIEDESVLTRVVAAPDRVVTYGDDPDQAADVWLGAGGDANPLLVIVHGGFWRPQYGRDQIAPMAVALAQAGWSVAAIGYRRVPGDPDVSVDDVRRALDVLPSRISHHDGRVLAVGHSAGGHLVLMAAVQPATALCGVLALAPAADLRMAEALALGNGAAVAYLGGTADTRPDLDPCRAPAPRVPTGLLHGDADAVVPLRVSESFHRAHRDVQLERLPDTGHIALIDPLSDAWPYVVDALAALGATSHRQQAHG